MIAQEIILNADLRPTKARLAVLAIIADAQSALSHPEIVDRLSSQKDFDRVTIYRVLDWLTEHKLIHRISGDNRAWKFQLSTPKFNATSRKSSGMLEHQSHAHLHCTVCGNITCVHELSPNFSKDTLEKYQVSAIEINIKGICKNCG